MKTVDHDTRVGAIVHLDGTAYTHCHFTDCLFVYSGGPREPFRDNTVINPTYRLEGPAHETVEHLRDEYQGGNREFVEEVIAYIRGAGTGGPTVP
jgi:hypothetical protein